MFAFVFDGPMMLSMVNKGNPGLFVCWSQHKLSVNLFFISKSARGLFESFQYLGAGKALMVLMILYICNLFLFV